MYERKGKCKNCVYFGAKCIEMSRPYSAHSAADTLCWCCKHSIPDKDGDVGCEWSRKRQEVDGREVGAITYMADHNGKMMKAYRVDKCPKFERG